MKTKTFFIFCLILFGAIAVQAQELKPFKADNGLWGFNDQNGKEIVPAKYDGARDFSDGLAFVSEPYQKGGFIDKTG